MTSDDEFEFFLTEARKARLETIRLARAVNAVFESRRLRALVSKMRAKAPKTHAHPDDFPREDLPAMAAALFFPTPDDALYNGRYKGDYYSTTTDIVDGLVTETNAHELHRLQVMLDTSRADY